MLTALRATIDAKLKGERIEEAEEPDRDNVIDLMAALRKSLGQTTEATPPEATPTRSPPAKRSARRTPATKRAAQPPQAPEVSAHVSLSLTHTSNTKMSDGAHPTDGRIDTRHGGRGTH
jgi:DNA end-binding protein Ku